jgi:hypothetical protein
MEEATKRWKSVGASATGASVGGGAASTRPAEPARMVGVAWRDGAGRAGAGMSVDEALGAWHSGSREPSGPLHWLAGAGAAPMASAAEPWAEAGAGAKMSAAANRASRTFSQVVGLLDVAQALLPAASALVPTLAWDTMAQPRTRVEMSLDTADTSVRATSVGGVWDIRASMGVLGLLCRSGKHPHECVRLDWARHRWVGVASITS